ncbi:MAG: hypothetical protein NC131_06500, partial [Roseburia sp.]|nr:hypothetical protein [Roseburia sp.]
MAKKTKKAAEPAKQEVERIELANGVVLVKYDDGSIDIQYPTIEISAEQAQSIFGTEEEDEDDSDDDSDDDDDDDEEDE